MFLVACHTIRICFHDAAPPAQIKPRLSMFDRDDSDDDNSTATNDVSRVNAQLAKRNTVLEQTMSAAVNAEPDIYDYDGAYDSFKAKEQAKHSLSQPIATKEAPVSILWPALLFYCTNKHFLFFFLWLLIRKHDT